MWWIAGIIGSLIGTVVTLVLHNMIFTVGTLRIDHSNPEKDTYRFDLGNLDALNKRKRITLKIDHNADLSQK